jgi:hypothetical protein
MGARPEEVEKGISILLRIVDGLLARRAGLCVVVEVVEGASGRALVVW